MIEKEWIMKFLVKKEDLYNGIKIVERATSMKALQPVLLNILIETIDNATIKLVATDLDLTVIAYVNAQVEEEGKITFLHKIKEGSVDKSYGIHVAKLANLPDSVIKRASEILKVYENKEKKRDLKVQEALPIDDLMPKKSKVEEELEKIDPLEITPIEALNILYKLKQIK